MHCIIAANIKMFVTAACSKSEEGEKNIWMINSNVGNNFIPLYKTLDMDSKAFAILPASCLFHVFFQILNNLFFILPVFTP